MSAQVGTSGLPATLSPVLLWMLWLADASFCAALTKGTPAPERAICARGPMCDESVTSLAQRQALSLSLTSVSVGG